MHLSAEEQNRNTSRLTKETYRDSSAMLTVAVVTMFFLPTTCVCVSLPEWIGWTILTFDLGSVEHIFLRF